MSDDLFSEDDVIAWPSQQMPEDVHILDAAEPPELDGSAFSFMCYLSWCAVNDRTEWSRVVTKAAQRAAR